MLRLCSRLLFIAAVLIGLFGRYGADDEADGYWTEERLKASLLLDVDLEGIITESQGSGRSARSKRLVDSKYLPTKSVGKIHFASPSGPKYCTATVVAAPSKSLIITAAQCLYNLTGKAYYKNFVFIPAEDENDAPLEKWPAASAHAPNAFIQSSTSLEIINNAVGFVVLKKVGNKAVADVTGSQQISFTRTKGQYTYAFGYSAGYASGYVLGTCIGRTMPQRCNIQTDWVQSLRCGLTVITGAPWIEKFNAASGTGTLTAVVVSSCGSTSYFVTGLSFNSNIKSLYDSVKSKT